MDLEQDDELRDEVILGLPPSEERIIRTIVDMADRVAKMHRNVPIDGDLKANGEKGWNTATSDEVFALGVTILGLINEEIPEPGDGVREIQIARAVARMPVLEQIIRGCLRPHDRRLSARGVVRLLCFAYPHLLSSLSVAAPGSRTSPSRTATRHSSPRRIAFADEAYYPAAETVSLVLAPIVERSKVEVTRTLSVPQNERALAVETLMKSVGYGVAPSVHYSSLSSAEAGDVVRLLCSDDEEVCELACHAARFLCPQSSTLRVSAAPVIAMLLRVGPSGAAAAAAEGLTVVAAGCDALVPLGAIDALVAIACHGSADAKRYAVGTLSNIARDPADVPAVVAGGAVEALVEVLRDGSDDAKERAALALSSITCYPAYEAAAVAAGAPDAAVTLLRNGPESGARWAVGLLSNIARGEHRATVVAAEAVDLLLDVLWNGPEDAKAGATEVISSLACSGCALGQFAAGALVGVARSGPDVAVSHALRALNAMAATARGRKAVLTAKPFRPLVDVLRNGPENARNDAVTAFQSLVWNHELKAVEAGAIDALVDVVRHGPEEAKLGAADVLLGLSEDHKSKERVKLAGALPWLDDVKGIEQLTTVLAQLGRSFRHRNIIPVLPHRSSSSD